jgi:hypothetical protein
MFGRIMFLDFVLRLMFLKAQRFGNSYRLPSSSKIMAEPALLGPLERASLIRPAIEAALCKEPNRVGATIIVPGDGNRSSFQNVAVFRNIR